MHGPVYHITSGRNVMSWYPATSAVFAINWFCTFKLKMMFLYVILFLQICNKQNYIFSLGFILKIFLKYSDHLRNRKQENISLLSSSQSHCSLMAVIIWLASSRSINTQKKNLANIREYNVTSIWNAIQSEQSFKDAKINRYLKCDLQQEFY